MNPQHPNWARVDWRTNQRGFRQPQFPLSTQQSTAQGSGARAAASETGGQGPAQHGAGASAGTRQPAGPVEGAAAPQQPQGAAAPAVSHQRPGGRVGTPAIDLVETDEEYLVLLDMAGFEEEHITIQADDDSLLVTAERPDDLGESTTRAHVRERPLRVQRRLDLPVGADVEGATASHDNGVCTVTIPRSSEGSRRTIAFQ